MFRRKKPEDVEFELGALSEGTMHGIARGQSKSTIQMQCLPLFRFGELVPCTLSNLIFSLHSLILALGNPRVDLLSLDIEGAEYLVLQTLPWEKVTFDNFITIIQ